MSEEVKIEGVKDFISEIEKEMELYSNGTTRTSQLPLSFQMTLK